MREFVYDVAMSVVTSRVLRVLRLFSPARPLWTVEEAACALGVSPSSAYRYVQELTTAGFLDRVRGGYALGPALVELDYLIRRHDPLIRAAVPIMRHLLDRTTQRGTVILCRPSRDHVLCIHQEQGTLPHPPAGYERGVAMPLFRGATSRVILAHLPARVQRRLHAQHAAAGGGGADWQAFAAESSAIRRAGYAETVGQVTPAISGVAAPVFQANRLVAALSLVTEAALALPPERTRAEVKDAAGALSQALGLESLLVAR